MKKLLITFFVLMLILEIGGCTKTENGLEENPIANNASAAEPILSEGQNVIDEYWDFYNGRAEEFVTAMANDDFDSATAMFDATMKKAVSSSALQDTWKLIVGKAGAFIDIYGKENSTADGYYICLITSRHETIGVTLRVVFSEDGLVAGLFIDDYPVIAAETPTIVQREGFADFSVVIGEGTDFPLNGILSVPDNATDKIPAVVLVHGSGAQDMDETIYENKPFRDIAEYLASNGIAVIRYNKRTFVYGAKIAREFGVNATIYEETIEDAVLAAEILKSDPRIDENKVFILGHSLGGMLAPRIHAEGGNFAGIISFAGSPRSLLEISYDQSVLYIEETMEGEEKIAALLQMETEGRDTIEKIKNMSDDEAKNMQMENGVSAYYYKEMDNHPVSEYVKNITIPFLIMQGAEDFQVYAEKDYALWQELLEGRQNASFKLYEGLNHLFMTSAIGKVSEYTEEYKIAGYVDGQVLTDIAEWIKAN